MPRYVVSHYVVQEPLPEYWQGLPYLTVAEYEGKVHFRQGKVGISLLSEDDVAGLVESRQVVALVKWETIGDSESVFLSPDGEVFAGRADNIVNDPLKRKIAVLPSVPRWLLEDRVRLRQLGIRPRLLLDSDTPDELHDATRQLLARAHTDIEEVLEAMRQPFVYYADSGYETDGDWLNQIRHALRQQITGGLFDSRAYPDTRPYFDQVLSWDRAMALRIVYLFPFFLSRLRSHAWGVIRYGWQRKIGVLIHTAHPCYVDGIRLESELEEDGVPSAELIRKSQNWLTQLVRVSFLNGQRQSMFRFFQGYVFEEILKEVLASHLAKEEQIRFAPMIEPIPRGMDGNRTEPWPRGMVMSNTHDLFFLDPAERVDLESDLKSNRVPDRRVIVVEHGLQIPVGIGYSLPLLKGLLDNKRWLTLLKAITPILRELGDRLRKVGIIIDPDVVDRNTDVIATAPTKRPRGGSQGRSEGERLP